MAHSNKQKRFIVTISVFYHFKTSFTETVIYENHLWVAYEKSIIFKGLYITWLFFFLNWLKNDWLPYMYTFEVWSVLYFKLWNNQRNWKMRLCAGRMLQVTFRNVQVHFLELSIWSILKVFQDLQQLIKVYNCDIRNAS